jgi:hypothetical protein
VRWFLLLVYYFQIGYPEDDVFDLVHYSYHWYDQIVKRIVFWFDDDFVKVVV